MVANQGVVAWDVLWKDWRTEITLVERFDLRYCLSETQVLKTL